MNWTDDIDAKVDFEQAIHRLTKQERRTICLHAGGLTQREIADCLGISHVRVNELIEQAKSKLVEVYPYQN